MRQTLLAVLVLALCLMPVCGLACNRSEEGTDNDVEASGDGERQLTESTDVDLFPIEGYVLAEGKKRRPVWGYIDRQGRIAIKPQFYHAGEFSDGRAFVAYPEGYWGIIDSSGTAVARTGYGMIFSQGRAAVLVAGKYEDPDSQRWGYVDRSGKVVIPGPFTHAWKFSEGLAVVARPDSVGDGRQGVECIDRDGRIVIPPRFRIARRFAEGLAAVRQDVAKGGGYVDRSGKLVISGLETLGGDFSEGLAPVGRPGNEETKDGYIDRQGRFVIEPQFGYAESFSDGRAVVKMTSRLFSTRDTPDWGVIDKSGKLVVPAEYAEIVGFSDGRAWVRPRPTRGAFPEKMHLIDLAGQRVSDVEVDHAKPFRNGLSAVHVRGEMGYVDRQGRYVWEPSVGPWQADIVDVADDAPGFPEYEAMVADMSTTLCRANLGMLAKRIAPFADAREAVPSLEWLVTEKRAKADWLQCPHAHGKRVCDYFFYLEPVPPKEIADDGERYLEWRLSRIVACDLDPHAADGNTRCVAFVRGVGAVLTPEEFAKELAKPVNKAFAEAFRKRGDR